MNIPKILQQHKNFFATQKTKDVFYRKMMLKRLEKELIKQEDEILKALYNDFKKPKYEGMMTETAIVISELKRTIKSIHSWAAPKYVLPSILNFPSSSKIYKEPYGTILLIAPWNYPFQLVFSPLIGAIAAGNTVVIKPSELTPNTSKITKEIIEAVFDKSHCAVVEGDASVSQELLTHHWDYIFFTGSVNVGKIIVKAAAEHLTPVTLELGGKNPCIIEETANIKLAAKRILWGKFINAGQTCIAPDYLLIHKNVKKEFIHQFKEELKKAYGENPKKSEDYSRIINHRNFDRLTLLLKNETVLIGGKTDKNDLYIAPTLIDEPNLDGELMKGEIFGPILPLISYENEKDIDTIIYSYEKPLALYIFTLKNSFAKKRIKKYSFGGGTINDTIVHFTNHRLPFGGVGKSGIGSYHGQQTFDAFSHKKGIVKRYNWLDIPFRYAPYKKKLNLLKTFMKWF